MKSKKLLGSLLLTLAAVIWGCAFVAQTVGMDHVGALTFHSIRSLLAGLSMFAVSLIRSRGKWRFKEKLPSIRAGIVCGLPLCAACLSQQYGLSFTTVGKAGFITSMYVLFVPLFCLVLGKKPGWKTWPSVALAMAGLYLLSMNGSFRLGLGDSLVLMCAVFFAVQVMCVDHFVSDVDAVDLNCVQFLVSGLITLPFALFIDRPDWGCVIDAWMPIVYAGVLSGGVGYALQIVAQKDVKPYVASLLMSLESVFAAISGWVLMGQSMSPRELLGSGLMFAAIILAQLPDRKAE